MGGAAEESTTHNIYPLWLILWWLFGSVVVLRAFAPVSKTGNRAVGFVLDRPKDYVSGVIKY